ncbi:MAG: hypothetical protein K0S25_1806, partial [Bacillus sp. (in: firmicutes)]|nr:hypothetical protein [Bacillus sp. (in: firmicutes)]
MQTLSLIVIKQEGIPISTEVKTISKVEPSQNITFVAKILPHAELTAAVICGVLIATGWILKHFDTSSASVAAYLLA